MPDLEEREYTPLSHDLLGARHQPALLGAETVAQLRAVFDATRSNSGSFRIADKRLGFHLKATAPLIELASRLCGGGAWPVRIVAFDKTGKTNWSTPWHQDRTVPVQRREYVNGWDTWSVKGGITHVSPPDEFLARMVTLKVFLDDVLPESGPIKVAAGSHRIGKVPAGDALGVATRLKHIECTGKAGDLWALATTILHSSSVSQSEARRRILHIDFAPCQPPAPLKWLSYS